MEIAFKLADAFYHFPSKSETEESFESFSVWNTFKLRNLKYVYPSKKIINILNEALLSLSSQHSNKRLQLLLIGNPVSRLLSIFRQSLKTTVTQLKLIDPFQL